MSFKMNDLVTKFLLVLVRVIPINIHSIVLKKVETKLICKFSNFERFLFVILQLSHRMVN